MFYSDQGNSWPSDSPLGECDDKDYAMSTTIGRAERRGINEEDQKLQWSSNMGMITILCHLMV